MKTTSYYSGLHLTLECRDRTTSYSMARLKGAGQSDQAMGHRFSFQKFIANFFDNSD